jgi:hypothetical protein
VATNPNPTRISDAWWWFMEQLVALSPGSINSGVYANKAGYHNTRDNLLSKLEWRNDYSIRLTADRRGPGDKASAGDWTFPEAQAGDFSRIRVYGARVRDAFNRRDPRLKGWREVLIQADTDLQAEGYDFQTWSTRTPDATHAWHGHFSELREHINSFDNKRNMLLVLGWKPKGDHVANVYKTPNNGVWISNGVHRRGPIRGKNPWYQQATAGMTVVQLSEEDRVAGGYPTWDDYLNAVAGPVYVAGGSHSHTASTTSTTVVGPATPG